MHISATQAERAGRSATSGAISPQRPARLGTCLAMSWMTMQRQSRGRRPRRAPWQCAALFLASIGNARPDCCRATLQADTAGQGKIAKLLSDVLIEANTNADNKQLCNRGDDCWCGMPPPFSWLHTQCLMSATIPRQDEEARLKAGTIKHCALTVLKDAGAHGMAIDDIMTAIATAGLRQWDSNSKRVVQFVSIQTPQQGLPACPLSCSCRAAQRCLAAPRNPCCTCSMAVLGTCIGILSMHATPSPYLLLC